jgi:cell division protease FtsH
MGRDYGHARDYSENVAAIVDSEIRSLIETAHQEAFDILVANRSILDQMVLELLERETLNKEEIEVIFAKVASWPRRPAWTGSVHRVPSTQAPVDVPAKKVIETVEPAPKKPARKKKATEE